MPTHLPERSQPTHELQRELDVRVDRPAERGADVAVLRLEPIEPRHGILAGQVRGLRRRSEFCQPLRVPSADLGGAVLLEQLHCEMANRLEHREARIAPSQEVVVDERGQGLERHLADVLGGLERAPAGEDAEPGEGDALLGPQQVVAPANRRGERPLACRGVARAGREKVRLAFEPLEKRCGGEQLRPGGGQLDRQRQAV